MSRSDDTFARKAIAGACAGGALLCLVLLAMQAFGSTPPPEPGSARFLYGSFFWPSGSYSVVSSSTSGLMILMAPATAVWGFSVHVRCSDSHIRHCLKGVALLVGLWMLDVIVKYRHTINNPQLTAFLWYLFYVPMTLIPLLCLLCALRASALDNKPWAPLLRRAAWATSIAIIALVLTNSFHLQVFSFDISRPDWQEVYVYNWGYWFAVAVYVAEYLGFFVLLFAASRRRLHGVIALLVMAAVPFVAYCLMYALRHEFAIKTNFSLNYSLTVVTLLELALDFGLLPSYSWYDEAFARLPLDLKVLDRDGLIAFATNSAGPVPAPVFDLTLRVARSRARDRVTRFRTSAIPHTLFKVYGVSGGAALLAEDVTLLDEQRRVLTESQERLRRSNEVLRHESGVRRELWRLESEERLLSSIEGSISDKVSHMRELLAALPRGSEAGERAQRRDMLTEVKLLVAYCKRKGALVLSERSDPEFDRDRLQLVFNETASDLRSIGVDCAAVVNLDGELPSAVVSVLYDCLYDVASVALFAVDPILMLFVSGDEKHVEMRAALDVAQMDAARLEAAAASLREDLKGSRGTLSLELSPTSLNAAIRMPVGAATRGGGGDK
ncbi:MAG: hypothetical protein K6E65_00945 [Olsenella sp.]|nr:hypothetical protein [Olsenella sp.]